MLRNGFLCFDKYMQAKALYSPTPYTHTASGLSSSKQLSGWIWNKQQQQWAQTIMQKFTSLQMKQYLLVYVPTKNIPNDLKLSQNWKMSYKIVSKPTKFW